MKPFYVNATNPVPIVEIFQTFDTDILHDFYDACVALSEVKGDVILQFHDSVFITSKMIGTIVKLNEFFEKELNTLYIYGISDRNLRLFNILGLEKVLNLSDTAGVLEQSA